MPDLGNFLVVDSGAVFRNSSKLLELSLKQEKFALVSVPEVLAEIKDEQSRQKLQTLDITVRTPDDKFLSQIIKFAKLTGDYASLSVPDLKVLALALQLEVECNGDSHLRSTPLTPMVSVGPNKKIEENLKAKGDTKSSMATDNPQSEINLELLSLNDGEEVVESNAQEISEDFTNDVDKREIKSDLTQDELDDNEGDWITPQNLAAKQLEANSTGASRKNAASLSSLKVACVTTDFAMQNVLVQMNIPLVSVDGMRITKLKSWVLRCHACFKITRDMSKIFCPVCGNNTLMKASVGIDKKGSMTIFLKRNFQYNNRGTRYSIPAPKGGRDGGDLILRSDQKEFEQALKRKARLDKKALSMNLADLGGQDEMSTSTGRFANIGKPIVGYGRKNPNERQRKRK